MHWEREMLGEGLLLHWKYHCSFLQKPLGKQSERGNRYRTVGFERESIGGKQDLLRSWKAENGS